MNLKNKKKLIARTLNVGVGRVRLNISSEDDVKEAITRQDIQELRKSGIVEIRETHGKRKKIKRKTRRRYGSRKKNTYEEDYVNITRKLRSYIKNLKKKGIIEKKGYHNLRKKIKSRIIKNTRQIKSELK